MRRIAKPMTVFPVAQEEQHSELGLPELDIEALLSKSAEILRREITNLMTASARGKLEAADSRDLVAYIKLLSELKTEKQKELASLTDEQLEKLIK